MPAAESPTRRGVGTGVKQMTSARACGAALCLAVVAIVAVAACSLTAAAPAGGLIRIPLPESDAAVYRDASGMAAFTGTDVQRIGQTGEPSLPCQSVRVLLPPDADLSTVKATITGHKWTGINGEWDIAPVGTYATGDGEETSAVWPEGKNIVDGRDADIYQSDALFPVEPICKLDTQVLRGWKMVQVFYAPYACNPVEKKVYRLSGNAIEISFERTSLTTDSGAVDLTAADEVREMTVNSAEMSGEYGGYAVSADTGRYVVITTSAIQAASSNLMDFVASKEARGFTVQVVTEGMWGGGTGDTAAENIRAWLQDNYLDLDINYVLLIGNPHPSTGDVPMKMCYPQAYNSDYPECPTDFYYAELTSENWDRDGDGKYGEYTDDFLDNPPRAAEVSVGRIPYYDNITDLDHILLKTIDYENAPASSISWRESGLLPMKPSDASTPGYQLGEEIKTGVLIPSGWTYHRVYDEDYGLSPAPETMPCNVTNVTNAWNGADFGAVFWWTHGSSTSASYVMDLSNVATLDDEHPGFTFQASCMNGRPETNDNLGYSLLKSGCISTVSASRVSWYEQGQTSFNGTATNSGMAFEYALRLIADEMYAGDALNDLRLDVSPYHEVLWMNYLDFNIYGCPAVGLSNSSPDQAAPSVVSYYASSVTATSATMKANLTSLGTADNVTVSFEWGTASGGPYAETTTAVKTDIGAFYFDLGSLDPGETFYYRAKVVGNGTTYGLEKSFTTLSEPPSIDTNVVTDVGTTWAILNGDLEDLGTAGDVTVSFEWGLSTSYGNETTLVSMGEEDSFSDNLTGLTAKTTYHFRAKAVGHGTAYGSDMTFTTLTILPFVTTNAATNPATTSVRLNGDLTDVGTASNVIVCFEWGTSASGPYPNATSDQTKNSTGPLSANLNGLIPGTTYYYRAKAVGDGTAYGDEKSFTALTTPPSVTTVEATGIGLTSATLNGNLVGLGTAPSVQVSFEWGLTTGYGNATTPQTMTGGGAFGANIILLTQGTTYHYRAKAVGHGAPVYGEDMQFTTPPPPSVTTKNASQITINSARLNGDLGNLGSTTSVTVSFGWGTNPEANPEAYPYWTNAEVRTSMGAFYFDLSGLIPGTTYYYQAKANGGEWLVYGGEISFTTLVAPIVITKAATNLTAGSAQLHGDLISLGSAAAVTVSFQWGTASGHYIGETTPELKSLTGAYYSDLAGLDSGTTYYCRAKAVGVETVYGTEMTFTTFRPPRLDSVSPSSGRIGDSVIVIITGTNFTGATAVSFSAEVSVGGFVLDSATQISATVSIGCNVNPGPRDVSVTTPGGTSTLTSGFEVVDVTPAPPNNVGPADETRVITLTPTLSSSAFSHLCLARSHAASQWQVTKAPGDYSNAIFDSGVDTVNLTNIVMPRGVLGEQEWYWWRVRYRDNRGVWSGWSKEASFSQPDFIRAGLNGPAEIRVYDSSSRVTGSIDGEVREQIAHSDYYSNTVVVVSPSDSCRFHVVGTQDGSYTLIVTRVVEGEDAAFRADDIPISEGEVHEYVIDWEALSHGDDGVTIKIDSDGNGAFDKTVVVEGDISNHVFASATRYHGMPFWLWILVGIGVIAGIAILLALLRADGLKRQNRAAA